MKNLPTINYEHTLSQKLLMKDIEGGNRILKQAIELLHIPEKNQEQITLLHEACTFSDLKKYQSIYENTGKFHGSAKMYQGIIKGGVGGSVPRNKQGIDLTISEILTSSEIDTTEASLFKGKISTKEFLEILENYRSLYKGYSPESIIQQMNINTQIIESAKNLTKAQYDTFMEGMIQLSNTQGREEAKRRLGGIREKYETSKGLIIQKRGASDLYMLLDDPIKGSNRKYKDLSGEYTGKINRLKVISKLEDVRTHSSNHSKQWLQSQITKYQGEKIALGSTEDKYSPIFIISPDAGIHRYEPSKITPNGSKENNNKPNNKTTLEKLKNIGSKLIDSDFRKKLVNNN